MWTNGNVGLTFARAERKILRFTSTLQLNQGALRGLRSSGYSEGGGPDAQVITIEGAGRDARRSLMKRE